MAITIPSRSLESRYAELYRLGLTWDDSTPN
jgi:hypothetical protein